MKIDLNADLGEGCASDAELLTLVSSANIACGFHAGDAQIMQACVREAIKNGVAIGAHPSFPDRENFGRSAMQLPPETVYAQTLYQIGALAAITRAQGGVMRHVKPHTVSTPIFALLNISITASASTVSNPSVKKAKTFIY